ncbi:MAG: pyridoxamine 5'-phosphate oxidase family protein [Chloroflexota bacterium]
MTEILVSRPVLPPGYVDNPISTMIWEDVVGRLTNSKIYWLNSVSPAGKPHSVPRWGVFIDEKFYYDGSPETRHARNILLNSNVSLHLESGDEAVIAYGHSKPFGKPEEKLALKLSVTFSAKYRQFGYAPLPGQWDDGGLYVFIPDKVLAWTVFFENPTRFTIKY